MDASKVTAKIVLATERPGAVSMGTDVWLESIGIMCSHVRFQVERPGERTSALGTFVFPARVHLVFFHRSCRRTQSPHGYIQRRNGRVTHARCPKLE